MESWRKEYIKGRARKVEPGVGSRFARCKIILMRVDLPVPKFSVSFLTHPTCSYRDCNISKASSSFSV
ncbi:MAG: hypothetical protein ACO2OS_00415 [Thermosphaera aggregans]|jgi:hypothetical protein|uniref:hypothetical protein n=1 Tax=Thermosphaera aggregans TaxID=54254 RepID=UPI003BFAE16F